MKTTRIKSFYLQGRERLKEKALFWKKGVRAKLFRRRELFWTLAVSALLADLLILKTYSWFIPEAAVSNKAPRRAIRYKERQTYSSIYEDNIFHPGPIPESFKQPAAAPQHPVKTNLPFLLKGTIVHANPRRSVATVKGRTAESRPYQTGDIVENQAKILKVERRKIIFQNLSSGLLEFLEIPEAPPPQQREAGLKRRAPNLVPEKPRPFRMKRSEVQAHLKRVPQILQEARMVPNWVHKNGREVLEGFRFASIKKGSVLEKLGFKKGDVITKVEGEEISSPEKGLELFNKFQTNSQIQIVVNGKSRTYNVDDDAPAEEVLLNF